MLKERDIAWQICVAARAMLAEDGISAEVSLCSTEAPSHPVNSEGVPEDVFSGLRDRLSENTFSIAGIGSFRIRRTNRTGRLKGKTVLLTGAARGIGKDLSLSLAREGAQLLCTDQNAVGAQETAEEINRSFGEGTAVGLQADVTDPDSVAQAFLTAARTFGGVDIFISNAGIVRAGTLDEMTVEEFERMAKVNTTGYFIGVKCAQEIMKLQHRFHPSGFCDIIQINSKSGLEGSNKNFAYSGSKFAGIGLTKSFALELCPYNIKVNAVCPGNYLDGPLWADPQNGLLLQFLRAGKVPGAKTVEDVKAFYEKKVPLGRGCLPEDIARAVLYCIEQTYETGQAIPVTGGQIMLH